MSAVNPYLPPNAAVADVSGGETGVQPVKFFSSQGRIGRVRYVAYLFFSYLLTSLAGGLLGAGAGAAGVGEYGAVALGVLAGGAYMVYFFLVTIQRGHDMGWNGWTSLLALIPIVVFIWVFKGGDGSGNRYGAPPPPNTTAVRIGAWLSGLIVIGMILVIVAVAIPAYQTYVMRAKAAQVK